MVNPGLARRAGPTELQRRAIARALAQGGASAVTRVRYGLYRVASSSRPGAAHTVSVDEQGRWRCSCPAGLSGRVCWHTAAVYVAKVEHGGGRVTSPARPRPPRGGDTVNVIAFRPRAA